MSGAPWAGWLSSGCYPDDFDPGAIFDLGSRELTWTQSDLIQFDQLRLAAKAELL